ncbi:MAG: restriction endonuclease subunit S [Cytophagales bacterium]|nr:restriction endonuclease subunit S [Cytophagales bacterium]
MLEQFPELTQYPLNASKVQDLMIQLALEGKLTKKWRRENRNIEHASKSLEKIKVKRLDLIKDKKIRNEEIKPIKTEEYPYELPKNWAWGRIGEIVNIIGGNQPPKGKFIYQYQEGYTRLVQIRDFKSDLHKVYVPNEYANRPFTKDDIMIGRYGPPVFQILRGLSGTYNVALMKAVPIYEKNLCRDFLFLLLQEPRIQKIVVDDSERTAGQSGVRKPLLNNIIFALPPLEEQKEIVRIVDHLKEEIEELKRLSKVRLDKKHQFVISSLHHLTESADTRHWELLHNHFSDTIDELNNVKKLRETILQLAVQGKLTRKWREANPDVEPASELLQRIKEEKQKLIAEKAFQKPRESGLIEGEELIHHQYPNKWKVAKVVDLCFVTKLAGFEYTKYISLEDNGDIPVIRAQNVKKGWIDESKLKYIDFETSKVLSRCALIKPCLLMTFIGAGIGDVAIFDKKERWHLAPNVAKLEPFTGLDPRYLLYFLMSPVGQLEIFKHSKATAQPSLSMGTIRDTVVTIPPFKEQEIIVQQVDHLMSLCDTLESHILIRDETAEKLMKAMVAEVLAGS